MAPLEVDLLRTDGVAISRAAGSAVPEDPIRPPADELMRDLAKRPKSPIRSHLLPRQENPYASLRPRLPRRGASSMYQPESRA